MAAKTFDRFPMTLSNRDGTDPRADVRIVRLGGTVLLFGNRAKYPGGTALAGSRAVVELDRFEGTVQALRGSKGAFLVTSADGTEWLAKKDGSCGCGDPVKTHRPRL